MLKFWLGPVCFLLLIFAIGCGDVDQIEKPQSEDEIAISNVIKQRWQRGYMTEDLELYQSAYWAEGFLYRSDMGTPTDPSDDVIFDDIRDELESAKRVFSAYQDIEIEISDPDITLVGDNKAIVRNHYKIQGFVADGTSLEGGYTGWYAEGDNEFTFEKREAPDGTVEWRITQWIDEAVNPADIDNEA